MVLHSLDICTSSILEILCGYLVAVEEKEADEKKEKIVTATKKGVAVLDQWLPDQIKAEYHVLQQVNNTRAWDYLVTSNWCPIRFTILYFLLFLLCAG